MGFDRIIGDLIFLSVIDIALHWDGCNPSILRLERGSAQNYNHNEGTEVDANEQIYKLQSVLVSVFASVLESICF